MFENSSNGDGPALGRELEIAELLRSIKQSDVKNVVWLTADTHYTAAHYYDPGKAQFTDFDPFWEFVSGPLNAGTFGPNALDATFDYLNGRSNSAAISLVPLKSQLAGPAGMDLVLQILSLQPACTTEQLTQMALGLLGGEIALCNPPPLAIGVVAPFLQSQLQTMTTIIPSDVTFIPGTLSGTPQDPRLRLNSIRSAIKLTPLLPILLLLAVTIFAVRGLVDWLTWWGWPFMITGTSSVLIGLVGAPLVSWILQLFIQNQGTIPIPPVLVSSIAETTGAVARQILIPVLVQGAILGFVGLGMAVLAMFLPRKQVSTYLPY